MEHKKSTIQLPKVNERIRIGAWYENRWVPICWAKVGPDASIYMGLAFDKPASGGMLTRKGTREQRINYSDVTFDDPLTKGSRISFKARTGEIHFGNQTLMGEPLVPLRSVRQLCLFMQKHPRTLPTPAKHNPNDYDFGIVGYEFSDEHPLIGALFLLPWNGRDAIPPVERPATLKQGCYVSFGFQLALLGEFRAIQIVLGQGPKGPWPPFQLARLSEQREGLQEFSDSYFLRSGEVFGDVGFVGGGGD